MKLYKVADKGEAHSSEKHLTRHRTPVMIITHPDGHLDQCYSRIMRLISIEEVNYVLHRHWGQCASGGGCGICAIRSNHSRTAITRNALVDMII